MKVTTVKVTEANLTQVYKVAEQAAHDEQVTRVRVQKLEAWAEGFSKMSLWNRLMWIVFGR